MRLRQGAFDFKLGHSTVKFLNLKHYSCNLLLQIFLRQQLFRRNIIPYLTFTGVTTPNSSIEL
jgi:hypothetical protein